jgi:GNAT superfamily N-acetyltransferase
MNPLTAGTNLRNHKSAGMNITETTDLSYDQKEQILSLWNNEYPVQLGYANITELDKYLDDLSDKHHYLLTGDTSGINGWAFEFVREGEKWFAIIVSSELQGQGFGTKLLDALKNRNAQLNGWVTDHNKYIKRNGGAYQSPMDFYLRNGFEIKADTRLETTKLSAVQIQWFKQV